MNNPRSRALSVLAVIAATTTFAASAPALAASPSIRTGSVIFIHPDGSGLGAWAALRNVDRGPDGHLNWDRLSSLGVYRGHLGTSIVSSSNGGATAHAFGVKPEYDDYGIDPDAPFTALSGQPASVMTEAMQAGKAVAVINSGHLCEPGTGVFLSSARSRNETDEISLEIVESGADIIFSGGEVLLLPAGVMGHHGRPGTRQDGRNVIERARELGYRVVYDRAQMLALPSDTERVLGVFAAVHTFNDEPEDSLAAKGLPLFAPGSPSVAEMAAVALRILGCRGRDFLMVVEEEGTDNFANDNNAAGTIEALRRADAAIGEVLEYMEDHPDVLLITAADSNAGGMLVRKVLEPEAYERPLPEREANGAPIDGRDGTASLPFVAAPDRSGRQFRFAVTWATNSDMGGGVVAKAHGINSELLPVNVDNTDIYRMMYATLFGVWLD